MKTRVLSVLAGVLFAATSLFGQQAKYVQLQATTPGAAQTGNGNITGTFIAGSFSGPLTGDVTGNVTGTSANVTGIVAAANGGLGADLSGAGAGEIPFFGAGVFDVSVGLKFVDGAVHIGDTTTGGFKFDLVGTQFTI
jgi:hypothetical protein